MVRTATTATGDRLVVIEMAPTTIDADEFDGDVVGSAVRRCEDPALVTGETAYVDDISKPRLAHVALLRSQYGHARVGAIDVSEAMALDGVLGAYTASDLREGTTGSLPTDDLDFAVVPDQPILAVDRVRYQGEPIAAVVAEGRYTAHEALDVIDVEYDRLDAVTDPSAAVATEAPTIHEGAPDNVAFEWTLGDDSAVAAAFEDADSTIEVDLANNRVLPTPMEPRGAVATYRRSTGELTVELSTQNPHAAQRQLAETLGIPDTKIRVRAPDVGGGFGAKLQPYAGHTLAAWCAIQLGRPVKWQATRSEAFGSTVHARDHASRAELAFDRDGTVRGLRVDTTANLGAYLGYHAAGIATSGYGKMLSGQYDIPAIHLSVTGVFTNTTPMSAYRGAGRPEACYLIERTVRAAARELDLDPAALRRRNFISSEMFPHEVATGHVYDSGDYEGSLTKALDLIDYEWLRDRQARLRDQGRYLGIGMSCWIDAVGGAAGDAESGLVRVKPSGRVLAYSGTVENGQGHRTSFAQILADRLGVAIEDVEIIDGDTTAVPDGFGTGGSRSIPIGGSALVTSAEKVLAKARRIAAHHLETSVEDVAFDDGVFSVVGAPDRSMTIRDVAARAHAGDIPDGMEKGLEAMSYYDPSTLTFPFGTHAAVVEVDPETGAVEFERYVAVVDIGNQINPALVEGQVHGGVAQGIGQALYEDARYDESGNLLTASLQDYAIPKAFHVPEMTVDHTSTPCPHNPLGAKGVGESGAIGAPPAVANAVYDALEPLDVTHIDMPLTQETVWRAVENADPDA